MSFEKGVEVELRGVQKQQHDQRDFGDQMQAGLGICMGHQLGLRQQEAEAEKNHRCCTTVDDLRFATIVKATVNIAVIRRPVSMRPAPD